MRLALYSVTYAGLWYAGPALSVEEVIERAARYGFAGVEVDGKRPHGFPLDWSSQRRREVRRAAVETGVALACLAANNDFTSAVPEEREAQLASVAGLIELAADLEIPYLRVFAAWPGVTITNGQAAYDLVRDPTYRIPATRHERWTWCRDALAEAARIAANHGVVLTLQNHRPLIDEPTDLVDMVREVDHDHLRCTMDGHLIPAQDAASVEAAVKAAGARHVFSHFAGEYERVDGVVRQKRLPGRREINYGAYVAALHGIGYRGYLSYELCHPFYPRRREFGNLDDVDEQVALAHEYMSGLVRDVVGAAPT